MAYKVFSNGDALTGSELNTYLMNQSVMVFATTTARDAALTTPSEGMVFGCRTLTSMFTTPVRLGLI